MSAGSGAHMMIIICAAVSERKSRLLEQAVARKGEGVIEPFAAILEATLEDLIRRHRALKMPPRETVGAWTERAIRSIYGRDSLAGVASAGEPKVSRPLKLQIPMPEEVSRTPGPAGDLRSAESLAESYAQASAELGLAGWPIRITRGILRTAGTRTNRAASAVTTTVASTHFGWRSAWSIQAAKGISPSSAKPAAASSRESCSLRKATGSLIIPSAVSASMLPLATRTGATSSVQYQGIRHLLRQWRAGLVSP